jgi:glyoxylate/hydroxypyruvate reductase A
MATPLNILFLSVADPARRWRSALEQALAGERLVWDASDIDPSQVDVVLVTPPVRADFSGMTRLKLAQSLWMGVESLLAEQALPRAVPLARMIDPHMTRAMVESALAHVMAAHLRHDEFARWQRESRWQQKHNPVAADRSVGILGLGELGRAVAQALAALEFKVRGWSRTPKELPGIETFAGDAALASFLAGSEILVALLPLTAGTRAVVNTAFLSKLPEGAVFINLARGALVVDEDLLAALAQGRLRHAMLDVFNAEPLPAAHPYWRHPRVTVTPHSAAMTNPRTAARFIAENLRRLRAGEALAGAVDRGRGY